MANSKQYKNVYTILEKVKKGEIQSYYSNEDKGLFSKLNFYKKADIIKPYIHYIDERKIENIVESQLNVYRNNTKKIQDEYNNFSKTAAFTKIPDDKKPDFSTFAAKVSENYKKFPAHLKYDVFKMYYNKMEKLEFEERDDKNYTKYKFLERANNPVGKIMTENANLKSSIFTRNMMMYYLLQMTQMEFVDPDAHQNVQQGLNGSSDFDNDGVDKALDKLFNGQTSKNMLDRLMKDAQETCKMMDESLEPEIQEKLFQEANTAQGGEEAGKISPNYMRQIEARLASIKLSTGALKEKIKKLLDKSASYFSSRKITKYDDLFNADNISGLEDYIFLHPRLRKVFAEDLMVKETKSVGKIDVYVDISGSMSSTCGVQDIDGNQISKIDFSKSLIAKLKEMDMLNDIYLFDTRLKKSKTDLISISMIDCNGGTNIDIAVNSIERNEMNALVITDAEDRCHIYSEKAFFIGVEGSCFNHFDSDVIQKYSQRNQVVVFNGSRIDKVNTDGYIMS
jgi:hypothetical protein